MSEFFGGWKVLYRISFMPTSSILKANISEVKVFNTKYKRFLVQKGVGGGGYY